LEKLATLKEITFEMHESLIRKRKFLVDKVKRSDSILSRPIKKK